VSPAGERSCGEAVLSSFIRARGESSRSSSILCSTARTNLGVGELGERDATIARLDLRAPPALHAGSLVAVVAPASAFHREELFRGLAWLSTRYRLKIDQRILARSGYLAGSDEARAAVLARAMEDTEVEAIVCARGGYGAMRILDALPWQAFSERPKHLVGFSDVTALHLAANARGIATVHGPNVTGLGRSITAAERASLIETLENGALSPWTHLHVMTPGSARGPVVGGNLAMV
jgi:muramoyltetrapeptide carboxypeptidase